MNNITKSLRKNINEIKETKKNLIIEHSIVQSRLKFVLEQNYKSDREKSMFLLSEMIILEEQGYDLRQLNEQFDIILCLEIIEHVADVDLFIKSCARLLKKTASYFLQH